MAVARTTGGGSSKPKKVVRTAATPDKKLHIERDTQRSNITYKAPKEPANPVGSALNTVGAIVGETVATGSSKTAKAVLRQEKRAEMKNERRENRREARQQERKIARTENRQERRERRRSRDGASTKGGDYSSFTGGGGGRGGGDRSKTTGTRQLTTDGFRTGGGFSGKGSYDGYQTPASFDRQPDTRFIPLPGGSSEGGGGAAGTGAGTSLSGIEGSDMETLLGAKKGKRQRKRRRTE